MTTEYESIRERIRTILNSENTTTFLNRFSNPSGMRLRIGNEISGKGSVNCFLDNVFQAYDDENVYVENFQKNSTINNLIINDKRINIKTFSIKNKDVFFNTFYGKKDDDANIKKNLKKIIEKLNTIDYFLFVEIKKNKKNTPFSIKYGFYLKSAKDFYFDIRDFRKSKSGCAGSNWKTKSDGFYFIIDKNNLGVHLFSYFFNSDF